MKKLILLASAAVVSVSSFAQIQNDLVPRSFSTVSATDVNTLANSGTAQKTSGLTDTLFFANTGQASGPYSPAFYDVVTPVDSGRFFGMNKFGYKGFAQLYRFSSIDRTAPVDTTYNVVGLYALFAGTAVSTSTKTVTLTMWKRDALKHAIAGRPKFYIYGAPSTTVTGGTKTVTFPGLTLNTGKAYYFSAPIVGVNYDIYAGYTLSSYSYAALAGDTIGLATSANTNGGTYTIEAVTLDSLISVNTLIQDASGAWLSPGFDPALGKSGDLIILPMIQYNCAKCGLAVNGFTSNNLTFFGNYPNPAVENTNIKFALKRRTDVTITILDAAGKTVSTIKEAGLSSGNHLVNVRTAAFAAGNYVYLVQTGDGDGIASQFTVVK